jgi:S-adenosylmethionine:tRNA ribosyltransferase-isomerase
VAACRAAGGRVVAVGTTVVRALETAALGAASSDPPPGSAPRWGSVADPEAARSRLSTAHLGPDPGPGATHPDPDPGATRPDPGPGATRPDPGPPRVRTGAGVSRLRIAPGHRLRVVDGLLTGLHEPEASHLDLLGAFLDRAALDRAYAAALAGGYLWHEFGDVCLLLPRRS